MRQFPVLAAATLAAGLFGSSTAQAAEEPRPQAQDEPFVAYLFDPTPCAKKDAEFDALLEKHKACTVDASSREQSDTRTLGQIAEATIARCRAEQAVIAQHVGRCEAPDKAARIMSAFEAWAQEGVMVRFIDSTLHSRNVKGVDPALTDPYLRLYRELYQSCVAFEARHGSDKTQDRFVNLTKANMRCHSYVQALQAYMDKHLTDAQAREIMDESADEAGGLADHEMDALGIPGSLQSKR